MPRDHAPVYWRHDRANQGFKEAEARASGSQHAEYRRGNPDPRFKEAEARASGSPRRRAAWEPE